MASRRIPISQATGSGGAATAAAPARKPAHTRVKRSRPVDSLPATEPLPVQDQMSESDEIARLAYSYWEARGFCNGSPDEDWLRAEQEIRSRKALAAGQ